MSSLIQKDIKILFWNPRSITNKKEELYKILDDIDIFVCVESWLSKERDNNFHFSGFKTFRRDRLQGKGGGILLLIRNNIAFKEIINLTSPHSSVEIAGISITNLKPKIDILVCYRAPSVILDETQWDKILNNISR